MALTIIDQKRQQAFEGLLDIMEEITHDAFWQACYIGVIFVPHIRYVGETVDAFLGGLLALWPNAEVRRPSKGRIIFDSLDMLVSPISVFPVKGRAISTIYHPKRAILTPSQRAAHDWIFKYPGYWQSMRTRVIEY